MITVTSKMMLSKRLTLKEQFRYPDCGSFMSEVERVTEDNNIYIWYECPRVDCDGQWLQRKRLVEAG